MPLSAPRRTSVTAELLLEPIVDSSLFVLTSPSDLGQQPDRRWLLARYVFCPLIASRAKRAQIRELLFAAEAFILDVAEV